MAERDLNIPHWKWWSGRSKEHPPVNGSDNETNSLWAVDAENHTQCKTRGNLIQKCNHQKSARIRRRTTWGQDHTNQSAGARTRSAGSDSAKTDRPMRTNLVWASSRSRARFPCKRVHEMHCAILKLASKPLVGPERFVSLGIHAKTERKASDQPPGPEGRV